MCGTHSTPQFHKALAAALTHPLMRAVLHLMLNQARFRAAAILPWPARNCETRRLSVPELTMLGHQVNGKIKFKQHCKCCRTSNMLPRASAGGAVHNIEMRATSLDFLLADVPRNLPACPMSTS